MRKFTILTSFAFLIILSAFAFNNADLWEGGYAVGDEATDFHLKNIDGKMVSLADFKDAKGFIVIFTCNTCPFAQANEDRLNALDKKYRSKGFPVIAINPNSEDLKDGESFVLMQERAKDKKFTFPYLFEGDQKIHEVFGAVKTPHVYVLNKEEDALNVRYIGAIDDSARDASRVDQKFVELAVDALLTNKPIKLATTKAIGCAIKS